MATRADVLAVAHTELIKGIPDALARTNPLLNRLAKRRFKKLDGGNLNFQFAVNLLDNLSQGAFNGTTDVIDVNPNQQFVKGELTQKFYYTNTTITLQDYAGTQDSPNAIADLVTSKMAASQNSFTRLMSTDVYGSGTVGNQKLNGLADIGGAAGTAYAGINDTDYPTWLFERDTTTTVVSYDAINSMLATLAERTNQQPVEPDLKSTYEIDLMISRGAMQARYTSQMQVQQRYMMDEQLVKSGFKGIEVNGVPWVIDAFTPTNYLYILSTESLNFGIRYGFWSNNPAPTNTKSQTLPTQQMDTSTSSHAGNLYCTNRRVNAVFTGLTS